MPVLRVFLECTSPTGRPGGAFDTFVRVSEDEMEVGVHLRLASRRAAILGYGGPHRVLETRRISSLALPTVVEGAPLGMEARLMAALALATPAATSPVGTGVPERSPIPRHPTRGRSRVSLG